MSEFRGLGPADRFDAELMSPDVRPCESLSVDEDELSDTGMCKIDGDGCANRPASEYCDGRRLQTRDSRILAAPVDPGSIDTIHRTPVDRLRAKEADG